MLGEVNILHESLSKLDMVMVISQVIELFCVF